MSGTQKAPNSIYRIKGFKQLWILNEFYMQMELNAPSVTKYDNLQMSTSPPTPNLTKVISAPIFFFLFCILDWNICNFYYKNNSGGKKVASPENLCLYK